MQVIPGTHKTDQIPHRDTFDKHNLLTRGQEVAVEVDRSKAVTSGITAVDSGGVYKAVDTVLTGGAAVRFYRYAPGDPLAKYTVTFSFVGTGQGEYTRQQAGVFVWNGPGGGDYMPLPFPQSTQIMDMSIDTKPLPDLTLTGEYARSTFNANRFSSLPGVAASDGAMKLSAAYSPRKIIMGGMDFGGLDLTLFERKVGSLFTPIDRTNDIVADYFIPHHPAVLKALKAVADAGSRSGWPGI